MRNLADLIVNAIDFRNAVNLELLELLSESFKVQALFLSAPVSIKVSSPAYSEHYVKRARCLLDSSLRSGKNVREIMSGIGLSYRQISRYFRDAYGISPKQYQLKVRMQEARNMLSEDPRTISLIATELGYSSAQHLSKQFKEFHGFSPKEYRSDT
jgi:AraC-like DNA-binding protein